MCKLKHSILSAEMLSTRCICPICFPLLSMHQWYGMDALNGTLKQLKRYTPARLVTGLTRSVSLENLYKDCGWLTLSQRRQQHKLSFMYKGNVGLVPSYISDLIPPLVSKISGFLLRNHRNIYLSYNRTSSEILYTPIH